MTTPPLNPPVVAERDVNVTPCGCVWLRPGSASYTIEAPRMDGNAAKSAIGVKVGEDYANDSSGFRAL